MNVKRFQGGYILCFISRLCFFSRWNHQKDMKVAFTFLSEIV